MKRYFKMTSRNIYDYHSYSYLMQIDWAVRYVPNQVTLPIKGLLFVYSLDTKDMPKHWYEYVDPNRPEPKNVNSIWVCNIGKQYPVPRMTAQTEIQFGAYWDGYFEIYNRLKDKFRYKSDDELETELSYQLDMYCDREKILTSINQDDLVLTDSVTVLREINYDDFKETNTDGWRKW